MGIFTRSPERALRARRAEVVGRLLDQLESGRSAVSNNGAETRHRGASRMLRSMFSWLPGLGSPRQDTPADERAMLISRSRDAYRNHMLGRAAISRSATNVVGVGLTVRPNVDGAALGLSDEEADGLNAELARYFALWAESPAECDAESGSDFYMLQRVAFISAMVSGDVFTLTPYDLRPGGIYATKLQLVEAERIASGLEATANPLESDGIRFDDIGRPTHCRVCRGYPNDLRSTGAQQWDWVAIFGEQTGRRRVLHVWNEKDRPGQVRGVPYLAPILEALQKLERFSQAELTAAVISAMFTVAIKYPDDDEGGGLGGGAGLWDRGSDDPNKQEASPIVTSSRDHDSQAPLTLGEGAVWELEPGAEPVSINPNRPNAQFDPFFLAIVKEIGAALDQPMEVLLLHFSSSYTAARAAFNQLWKFIRLRRSLLTVQFCQPVYELIIDEMVARGLIVAPGYSDPIKRRAYTRALWIGQPLGALNEQVEAKAATERIANGTSNETLEAMALYGEDWKDIAQDRAREIRWKRMNGVPVYVGGSVHEPSEADPDPDKTDPSPTD